METTLLLAKLFGVFFLAAGFGLLLNHKHYQKVYADILKDKKCHFFLGMMLIVVGLVVVLYHNIWAWEWPALITLFGWAMLIKGTFFLVFPQTLEAFKNMFKGSWVIVIAGGVYVALGIVLGYYGFFV